MPDTLQIPELKVLEVVKPPLPVLAHRQEVLTSVLANRVTILSGETGSGKTTQVPQFLVDDRHLVPDGKVVVVTQPRRIACITIAEHVARERGEAVGESVGYQIRFVNNTSPSTRLIFCTTAVMLRRLHSDPFFERVAVLCVDEVHERDVYTEFLLVACRERMLRGEMRLRLVLMSATLQADMFVDFFRQLRRTSLNGEPPDPDPESCVKIEGRMFPVKEHFLEDALEWTGHQLANAQNAQPQTVQKLAKRLQETRGQQYSSATLRSLAVAGERDVHQSLMCDLVHLFHTTAMQLDDGNQGAILIFLPGWADIASMHEKLSDNPAYWPLPLHSNLSPEDQQLVFEKPPEGLRKVVLSTNLAETSVTIDDVMFVINSGVMKERVFDAERHLGSLDTSLNTQANVTQRAGRAGRTHEGVVVHLFPKWKLSELREWPTPEILSKSLEEVVLNLLALGLGDPHEILATSLSAPSVACVEHAIWLLQEMSMMVPGREGLRATEALLPLGRWLAPIPLHPMSSKALLYGAVLGVLLPVAASVAFLNVKSPFVQLKEGQSVRGGREVLAGGKHSDHYAMASAYLGWRSKAALGEGDAFAEEHGLSRETLDMGDQLVRSLMRMMADDYEYDGDDVSFADDADSGSWTSEAVFDDPRTWTFCKAALSAAFAPFFVRCSQGKFESDSSEECLGHQSSINAAYQPISNPYAPENSQTDDWLVFSDSMLLGKTKIMESTVVSANYVLLFSKNLDQARSGFGTGGGDVAFDGWRGTLAGGEPAVRTLQNARRSFDGWINERLEQQTATMLHGGALEYIAEVLTSKSLALKQVSGTRCQRIGAKEAATMFVGSIPDQAEEDDIRELFAACGHVEDVGMPVDRETGRKRGFGFVTMGSRREAEVASQRLNGSLLHGRRIRIDLKGPGQGKGAKGKGRGSPVVRFAKPAERRAWIKSPTDQERQALSEVMTSWAAQVESRRGSGQEAARKARREQRRNALEQERRAKKDEEEMRKVQEDERLRLQEAQQIRKSAEESKRREAKVASQKEPQLRRKREEDETETCRLAEVHAAERRRQEAEARGVRQQAVKEEIKENKVVEVEEGRWRALAVESADALLPPSGAMQQWCELLVDIARVHVQKQKAVEGEDFKEAGRLKRREVELTTRVEAQRERALGERSREEELRLLGVEKRRAVQEEDFERASRLKKRIRLVEEQDLNASAKDLERQAWTAAFSLADTLGAAEDGPAILAYLQTAAPLGSASTVEPCVEQPKRNIIVKETRFSNHEQPREERQRQQPGSEVQLRWGGNREQIKGQREDEKNMAGKGEEERWQADMLAESCRQEVKDEMVKPVHDEHSTLHRVKTEATHVSPVKAETTECPVPCLSVSQLLRMSNQDLWQHAWAFTWQASESTGGVRDQAGAYAQAQQMWKTWLVDRDRLGKERAAEEGRQKAEDILRLARAAEAEAAKKRGEEEARGRAAEAEAVSSLSGRKADPERWHTDRASLDERHRRSQEEHWQDNQGAKQDWERLTAEAEKRRKANEEAPKTGRDLCALVKQRCPADQPLQFERLLAVCPKGTTVHLLVQAMAKEPQEFRQNWDGSEYCVRPVNSRCVDWLPVQVATVPPGFRAGASLPEEMLTAAKSIFEERLKPQGQAADDPLVQFLTVPGRAPHDTPLPFEEILRRCPPGTAKADLIRCMSKRRDVFRQNLDGSLFCIRPRAKCKDWAAVNPYLDPTRKTSSGSAASGHSVEGARRGAGEMDGDY